jgi:hypothetical protein
MIKMGKIEESEITVKDVERAQLIYGKDMGTIMGRTTREKPEAIQLEPKMVSADPKPVVLEGDLLEIESIHPRPVGNACGPASSGSRRSASSPRLLSSSWACLP